MLDSSEGFWRGTTKPLRVACVGGAIAAVGACFGFAVSADQPTPLFLLAYTITACGITMGGFGVAWGILEVFRVKQ